MDMLSLRKIGYWANDSKVFQELFKSPTKIPLEFVCFPGLLKAVARTYYKSALTIEKVSQNIEKTSQRTESSVEHVVFSLAVTKLPIGPDGLPPPTFIAQTRKHAEKQIHQEVGQYIMKLFALLAICEGNPLTACGFCS